MIIFAADAFLEQYVGGAELTTEAVIESCLTPARKVVTGLTTPELMESLKEAHWVFGNFSNLTEECMLFAVKNLSYSVLEYDYKFCKFRSPEKHILFEGECNCATSTFGKLRALFLASAKKNWWMSESQKNIYQEKFPFLGGEILSSVFSDYTLNYIEALDTKNKNDKWLILDSKSWIKGVDDAVKYAEENNLEYELVWGLKYEQLLEKMASSRGLIFFPRAGDTCPRMVIEAKLLGCELILNDNVQHKDEDWFKTKETCLQYLKQRKDKFWNCTEQHVPQLVSTTSDNNTRYIIITPFYNVGKYIFRCIESLKRQQHKNFKCILIDDMSTDGVPPVLEQRISDDPRFTMIRNKEKKYALKNIYDALKADDLNEEDVVILLDGDDWLASSTALNVLNNVYENDYLVTYGSYIMYPYAIRGPEPSEYPAETISNNLYRKDRWRASHLRTFKHHLWRNVSAEDLKDKNGNFYEIAYDQAIMLPLLEMAGPKVKYVDTVLHVYNKENPLNVDKVRTQEQVNTAQEIRSKKPYERL